MRGAQAPQAKATPMHASPHERPIEVYAPYEEYQRNTDREIPVFILERV